MPPDELPIVGRWTALNALGGGGQGAVWRATLVNARSCLERIAGSLSQVRFLVHEDPKGSISRVQPLVDAIERYVSREAPQSLGALKILHAIPDSAEHAQARKRLNAEAELLTTLKHPSLIRLLEVIPDKDALVMEYHPGGALTAHLTASAGQAGESLRRLRPLADAVAVLHENGFVHRDIKPDNILLSEDGRLVLADAGIVFFTDPDRTRCTGEYESVGSHFWMPPWAEGVRLDDVTANFDVYSLGKVLWSLASGRSKLSRESWNAPKNDLTLLFPNDPGMRLINSILANTVVQEEEECLPTAREVVEAIDEALALQRGLSIVGGALAGRCQACGRGDYEPFSVEDGLSLYNGYGLRMPGQDRLRIYECGHCGHALLFGAITLKGNRRPAWRPNGGVLIR